VQYFIIREDKKFGLEGLLANRDRMTPPVKIAILDLARGF
jgi:hypothetical protein